MDFLSPIFNYKSEQSPVKPAPSWQKDRTDKLTQLSDFLRSVMGDVCVEFDNADVVSKKAESISLTIKPIQKEVGNDLSEEDISPFEWPMLMEAKLISSLRACFIHYSGNPIQIVRDTGDGGLFCKVTLAALPFLNTANLIVAGESHSATNIARSMRDWITDSHSEKALIYIQSMIRRHRIIGVQEPGGIVPTVWTPVDEENPTWTLFAYAVMPETENQLYWMTAPQPISDQDQKRDTHKTLTHRDNNTVGLTVTNQKRYTKIRAIPPDLEERLLKGDFPHFVAQIMVNRTLLISKNLGGKSLGEQIKEKTYRYDLNHFLGLARDIDALHAEGIVHRDLKPPNMFLVNGELYVADNDSLGKVGEFKEISATKAYLVSVFWPPKVAHHNADNNPKDAPVNAYKKDNYAFFISMIEAWSGVHPTTQPDLQEKIQKNIYIPFGELRIKQFCSSLPCHTDDHNELERFLTDPLNNDLSKPLFHYLVKAN